MNSAEEWSDIVGYEGMYLVSNLGRVLSVSRMRKNGKGREYRAKSRILSQTMTSTGYHKVDLKKRWRKKGIQGTSACC